MSRQQEFLKEKALKQLDKMSRLLKAGATICACERRESENSYGLDIKISYDAKVETRMKILFPPEE